MNFLKSRLSWNFPFLPPVSGQRMELQTWMVVLYRNKGTFIKLSKFWNGPNFSLCSIILTDFLPRSNLKVSSSLLDAVFNTCKMEACCSEEKSLSSAFPGSFVFSSQIAALGMIFLGAVDFFRQQELCSAWNKDDANGTGKHRHLPKREIWQNVSWNVLLVFSISCGLTRAFAKGRTFP